MKIRPAISIFAGLALWFGPVQGALAVLANAWHIADTPTARPAKRTASGSNLSRKIKVFAILPHKYAVAQIIPADILNGVSNNSRSDQHQTLSTIES